MEPVEPTLINMAPVVLEVDGVKFSCDKKLLQQCSPYFDAMFSGNFKENDENLIKIQNVSSTAMKIIINYLTEESLHIPDEELLETLQAACMFQVDAIRTYCLTTIIEILTPEFGLDVIFLALQLDLQDLYQKALCISLLGFKNAIESSNFLNLDIKQVNFYLSHPALNCTNEIEVFEAAMKWWYEHENCPHESTNETDSDATARENILLEIIKCVNYSNIDTSDLRLMLTYPGVKSHRFISDMLRSIISWKTNKCDDASANENVSAIAKELVNREARSRPQIPCIVCMTNIYNSTTQQIDSHSGIYSFDGSNELQLVFPLRHVGNQLGRNLEGYRIQVWDNKILLMGGEIIFGYGNWNRNCWMYDTTKDKWTRITTVPFVRRHFKTCIVKDILYLIGGTGQHRIVQNNMDCYNLVTDEWLPRVQFPYEIHDVECCEFQDNLFIACGGLKKIETLLYKPTEGKWIQLTIADPSQLYKSIEPSRGIERKSYTPFVYNGDLYLSGNYLLGLKLNQLNLEIFYFGRGLYTNDMLITAGTCLAEGVLYRFRTQDCANFEGVECNTKVESFSLVTKTSSSKDLSSSEVKVKQDFGCFGLFHHSLL